MSQQRRFPGTRRTRPGLVVAGLTVLLGTVIAPIPEVIGANPPREERVASAPNPPTEAEIDDLLAKADADLRKGLMKLSDDFPQLKVANFGTLLKAVEGSSGAGTVEVGVGHYSGFKGGQITPVAKEDTYAVVVVLRRVRPADNDPNGTPTQMVDEAVYAHLGLVGRVHTSAGDEKLDAALKKLVDEALAPLAKLDREAAAAVKASDPVTAIQRVLPEGWSVKEVADGRYPSNRPEGKGKEIVLVSKRPPGNAKDKEQLATVWIMPPDYQDGGQDPTHGQSQTAVPTLISTKPDAKVYLWGHLLGGAPDWPTMERDILKALYP